MVPVPDDCPLLVRLPIVLVRLPSAGTIAHSAGTIAHSASTIARSAGTIAHSAGTIPQCWYDYSVLIRWPSRAITCAYDDGA
jgi:hypothetical protein